MRTPKPDFKYIHIQSLFQWVLDVKGLRWRNMYSMYYMRGGLSFVVLHLCSQAKCFDLSRPTTWCPLPPPSSPSRVAHPWHSNLLGFSSELSAALHISAPLCSQASSLSLPSCRAHCCPRGRAQPYSHTLSPPVCPHCVVSVQWTQFIKLHLDSIFNMMVKTHLSRLWLSFLLTLQNSAVPLFQCLL